MRLEPKSTDAKSQTRAIALASLLAVAFTLLIVSLLVVWAGAPVFAAYGALFKGGFGDVFALSETLTRATPLILTRSEERRVGKEC